MRLPIIERDEYVVSLQPYEDADGSILVFIHCDILKPWTKTIKSSLKNDFSVLCSLNKQSLFTLSDNDDSKHHKFLAMFDFKYLKQVKIAGGEVKHIYIKLAEK